MENQYKTERQIISYFMLQNLSTLNSYVGKTENRICDFCKMTHRENHILIKKYGYTLTLCYICQNFYNNQIIIINKHQGISNPFGIIEHKLEVTIRINQQVIFFNKIQIKKECFNYIGLINEPWYQRNVTIHCQLCRNDLKYYQSRCKQCYNYSYKLSCVYNLLLLTHWIEHKDILTHIIYNFIFLIKPDNFDIDYMFIYNTLYNVKPVIKNIVESKIQTDIVEKTDELDLITEDNVDFYLEDDYQDEDLGYWDDES
jgi:hypothetical protein